MTQKGFSIGALSQTYGAWQEQTKYSLLSEVPSSSQGDDRMAIKDKVMALKSRAPEQSTRIDSPELETNATALEVVDSTTIYRVYKRRWFGVAIIMLLNIVSSWSWIAFAPVAGITRDYFNLSSTTPVNWLSTVVLFVYCIVSPLTAYVFHHHGVRTGMIIGAVLTVVGGWLKYAGARASSTPFAVVIVGQIIAGAGQPFFLNVPTHYSDKWFSATSRVSATALMSLANAIGAAVGQLVNPFLAPNASDIPNMILYFAIIATVVNSIAPFTPSTPPTPPAPSNTEEKLHLKDSLRALRPNVNYWLLFVPFSVYLGFFNAFSTLLQQFVSPYGYSDNDAGIAGAILILTGLVAAALLSPLIDRFHFFLPVGRVLLAVASICYLAFIWVIRPNAYAGICVLCALLGAASFSLLPLALELSVELTHPVLPEVTASIYWIGGQFLGGIFIIIMNALRDDDGVPKENMTKALIFQGVVACIAVPWFFFIKANERRLAMDITARYQ